MGRYTESLGDRLRREVDRKDWKDILLAGGVDSSYLVNRHVPCPVCRSEKRHFRFDNKEGSGSWICVCGYGDGIALLSKVAFGGSFIDAAKWVLYQYLGLAPGDATPGPTATLPPVARRTWDDELTPAQIAKRRAAYRDVFTAAKVVVPGDPVWLYLTARLPGLTAVPKVIRFHPGLEYIGPEREDNKPRIRYGKHACMVTAVQDDDGRCCNIHRTYLTHDGRKLEIVEDGVTLKAKKLMPAVGVRSYAARLAPHQGVLGVSEGIETGLAANLCEGLPTWALVSTSGMKSFNVPQDVRELVIFADNDERTKQGKRPGFEAATALAEKPDVVARVRTKQLKVRIVTPGRRGQDMADFLLDRAALAQRQAA